MDLKREVEYRLAKWGFANLYHEEKIDEKTYHQLLNRLLDECNPPMKSIEERFDDIGKTLGLYSICSIMGQNGVFYR